MKTKNSFQRPLTKKEQNQLDSKAGTTARAIETLMGEYFA